MRRMIGVIAMATAALGAPHAFAQSICDNPTETCGRLADPSCLSRLGAGAIPAPESAEGAEAGSNAAAASGVGAECNAQLNAYRSCLASVTTSCKPKNTDLEATQRALEILQRAVDIRPTGDVGQIAAIESLLEQGSSLAGADLRGLSFAGGQLDAGDFSGAQLTGVNAKGTQARSANFERARLDFSDLRDADFAEANMNATLFYFVDASSARFVATSLKRSNWFGAVAAGTNFKEADLTNAGFYFADLRGADFSGADLTGAQFYGSVIDGAVFDGATIANTDFSSVTGSIDQLSAAQREEVCGRRGPSGAFTATMIQSTPSTRFESGRAFRDLATIYLGAASGAASIDQTCVSIENPTAGRIVLRDFRGVQDYGRSVKFYFESELLGKAGRQNVFRERFRRQAAFIKEGRAGGALITRRTGAYEGRLDQMRGRLAQATAVSDPVALTGDVAMMLALRDDPSLADAIDWRGGARHHLTYGRQASAGVNEWPAFFPPKMLPEQIDEAVAALFRRWTMNRAEALPTTLQWTLRGSGVSRLIDHKAEAQLPYPRPPGRAILVLGGLDLDETILPGQEVARLNNYYVALDRPFASFKATIAYDRNAPLRRRSARRVVTIEPLGAQPVRQGEAQSYVVHARVVRVDFVDREGGELLFSFTPEAGAGSGATEPDPNPTFVGP